MLISDFIMAVLATGRKTTSSHFSAKVENFTGILAPTPLCYGTDFVYRLEDNSLAARHGCGKCKTLFG